MKVLARVAAFLLGVLAGPVFAQEEAAQSGETNEFVGGAADAEAQAAATQFADLQLELGTERPALIPVEHFAGRSAYREFALSPDGAHVAIKTEVDGDTNLLLIAFDTKEVVEVYRFGSEQKLVSFEWAGPDKIMLSVSLSRIDKRGYAFASRLFVQNIVSGEIFPIEVGDQVRRGGEVLHIDDDGAFALIAVQRNVRSFPSVYRYPLEPGGERERIVRPISGVWDWFADETGTVRLGLGPWKDSLRIYYRENADDNFELVENIHRDDDNSRYWNVLRIVSGSDQGYVLEENEDGRIGVRLFDYSTGETVGTFYENPDWDVTELWFDREGQPLAALYTDDRERIEWFDEELEALYNDLRRTVRREELHIVSRSRDSGRMLIWAGGEADPGALFLVSLQDSVVSLLTDYRPDLDISQLARPVPVRYNARDGLSISAYLTLPRGVEPRGLPMVIMPHGGPFGVRDRLEYNDELQLLANRGYAVLQPNFRGSGGYGEAFYEAGRGQVGRGMQDDIDDAMDWAVEEGIADRDRICVVGSSYGGFSALWAVLRNPERYRCAASWAGVTDWDRMMRYDRRYLGRERARDLRELEEGEDADLDDYSPVNFAAHLSRPVLLAHGTEDRRVPVAQFHTFESASEDAPSPPQTLLIEGEGHSLTKAENEQKWFEALEAFLAEHNPAEVLPH